MSPAEPHRIDSEESVSRREFLRAGGIGAVGLTLTDRAAWAELLQRNRQRKAIVILLTGGPSQLDTFDPKPEAGSEFRGTLGAIETSVPGIYLNETFPLLAQRAHRFSLIRSVQHHAAPIHETGLQLMQTGRLSSKGVRFPHFGRVVAQDDAGRALPNSAIWPMPLQSTGVSAYLGQPEFGHDDQILQHVMDKVVTQASETDRRKYGPSRFGELLWQSRLMLEQGVRCVTVNLFQELGANLTWDAHGDPASGPATIADCRDHLCPELDRAMAGLLDDLSQRGLLDDTLVMVVGEMGRTPRINSQGGRDHWTKCFSALVAGGKTIGGQVIGASDDIGAYPIDRPVHLAELPASLMHWFGINAHEIPVAVGKQELPLIPDYPLLELWGSVSKPIAELNENPALIES